MSSNSAGKVGAGNEGKTDMARGEKMQFGFTKGGRKTGKVAATMSAVANDHTVDGNKRKAPADPRLAG